RIDLSPDSQEAKVTFIIAEGRQYRVRNIEIFTSGPGNKPLKVFAPELLIAQLAIQRGDVYSQDLIRKSVNIVQDAYGMMGYVGTKVDETSVRVGESAEVDLLIGITEGRFSKTGLVRIQGNFLTKDKVIRRELRFQPGRPVDAREFQAAKERL